MQRDLFFYSHVIKFYIFIQGKIATFYTDFCGFVTLDVSDLEFCENGDVMRITIILI